jgi:hypothetical protein
MRDSRVFFRILFPICSSFCSQFRCVFLPGDHQSNTASRSSPLETSLYRGKLGLFRAQRACPGRTQLDSNNPSLLTTNVSDKSQESTFRTKTTRKRWIPAQSVHGDTPAFGNLLVTFGVQPQA